MPAFKYSPANLSEIAKAVSVERLEPYLAQANSILELAVCLYEQNTLLSESLYGILQGLEVTLRNSIHIQLAAFYGRSDWYEVLRLEPEQFAALKKAKAILNKEGKPLGAGRVVAELSFGFWTGLMGPKYNDLWRNSLVRAFPRRPLQRTEVQIRLNRIRRLRNRIAHHEPIVFSGQLSKYANQIFDTVSWMNPVAAHWVRSNSSFDDRYAEYRKIFP